MARQKSKRGAKAVVALQSALVIDASGRTLESTAHDPQGAHRALRSPVSLRVLPQDKTTSWHLWYRTADWAV